MEKSTIYDLINIGLIDKWKDEIAEKEGETWYFTREKEAFGELETKLGEREKELLHSYSLAVENKYNYFYYNLIIKFLNKGIKIGMDLEKAFAAFEE